MNGGEWVSRVDYDREQGETLAAIGRLHQITFDGIEAVKGEVRLLRDDLDEVKDRSSVFELRQTRAKLKAARDEIAKRDAHGDRRINWLATFLIGLATAAGGALFHWLATRGH